VWFVLINLVLYYIVRLIYYPLSGILHESYNCESLIFYSLPLWLQFVLFIPMAYILTIIHFWLIFKIFRHFKYFINKNFIIILVSSLLIGISHYGQLTGIIMFFLAGMLLGYSYIVAEEKKLSPVLIVTIILFLEMVIEYANDYIFY